MEIRGFGRSGLGSISGVAFSFFPLRDGVGSFVRDGGGNGDFVAVKMMVASRPSLLRYSKEPMADFPESLFLVGSVCVLRVSRVNFLPAAWFLILWRGRTTEMRYSASVFGSFIGRAPCNFVSDAVPFSVSLSLFPFGVIEERKLVEISQRSFFLLLPCPFSAILRVKRSPNGPCAHLHFSLGCDYSHAGPPDARGKIYP